MLNRRVLRIKVMQALYGFFQSGNSDLAVSEKNMFRTLERIYDLYLLQFLLLADIHRVALKDREDAQKKYFPDEEDLMKTTPFTENPIFEAIENSEQLNKLVNNRKLGWGKYPELAEKLFRKIKQMPEYKQYIHTPDVNIQKHKDYLRDLVKQVLWNEEYLHSIYEEENIHWGDDIDLVNITLLKAIEGFNTERGIQLSALYKDEKEDKDFVSRLFRKCILDNEELNDIITPNTQNWEAERIAYMDLLLMKMAVCEMKEFPSIPVKVSLNEYIEISKLFSTPKSNSFINGILDKIALQLKAQGAIKKTGRGLIEN
ncbi:MAG: transcription antitermination factor NusB [Flavobacteriales bacterium]|nr:transcription antitermination factor NusB [Flavobacteriales bacterium]